MNIKRWLKWTVVVLIISIFIITIYQASQTILNNPYPNNQAFKNIYYSSFSERPKTLDPAKAYTSDELLILNQIYEPPLQYHYLKRPYALVPLTADSIPQVEYFDSNNNKILDLNDKHKIAYSVYTIKIKPKIYYQPHFAFVKNIQGNYINLDLNPNFIKHNIKKLLDFKLETSRELTAEDFIYQIKRIADPRIQSPIYGLMSDYIIGLKKLNEQLSKQGRSNSEPAFRDLRQYDLSGVKLIDKYTYQIKIKGSYPQFIYWLAMPFFASMPWEVDKFYSQKPLSDYNISLDWYPVGTGPYLLKENNPNRVMILIRNPNFHQEFYPADGMPSDKEAGLLSLANRQLPFIDKIIFSLEKEFIPRWNKFLQGYYDTSGISSDSFDQAINISGGEASLSDEMKNRGIYLQTSIYPAIFYTGFNMLDNVVGGYSEKNRKLRQAIAIALDYEEYITIFLNGRGIAAYGPIPPGIFGSYTNKNEYNQQQYNLVNGNLIKKSLDEAKKLLADAGYPNGRDQQTGQPLILNYDIPSSSAPDAKANSDWLRKQFAKLGIQLNVIETQYNRFQEKIRLGNTQLYSYGWHADYPDPENFLFLFYSPNGEVKFDGANASNYSNKIYDALFEKVQAMPNSPQRIMLIHKMVKMLQYDQPWIWGFFPKNFALYHSWVKPGKIVVLSDNTLKYRYLYPKLREELRIKWNKPVIVPMLVLLLLILLSLIPIYISYVKFNKRPPKKIM